MAASVEVKVDAHELSKLFADLKQVSGNLQIELRRGVNAAAKPITNAVKGDASFSSRIPATVKAKASFAAKGASVAIVAGGAGAPEAAPLWNGGRRGKFRHPVYGNRDVWVEQDSRAFFVKEPQAAAAMDKEMSRVMNDVARKAGFR